MVLEAGTHNIRVYDGKALLTEKKGRDRYKQLERTITGGYTVVPKKR